MNNVYIFSKNNFIIKHLDKVYKINKNSVLKLDDCNTNNTLTITKELSVKNLDINLKGAKSCNNFITYNLYDNLFIQIVCIDYDNLIQKQETHSSEIFIYTSGIRLIYKNSCYTHFFEATLINYSFEDEKFIYIYNNINLLAFNKQNHSFYILKVEKLQKNNKNTEILCKIPYLFNYFLLFSFNDISLNLKKLKKGKCLTNDKNLIYYIFSLCKYSFDDAKNMLGINVDYEKLKEYIQNFENIVEINSKYYLYNHNQLEEISFKTENNKIIDID